MKIIIFVSFLIGVFLILNALSQTDIKTANNSAEIQKNGSYIENYPKQSDYWPDLDPIEIDDLNPSKNWTTTNQTYDWCIGSGTLNDPYVIKNVIINASGPKFGILINNSRNVYFVIKNCTIFDSGSLDGDAGIRLENTSNGTLINNNCSNNNFGIFLYNSRNNSISLNNITFNEYGISLENNCDNNTIYGNKIIDNDVYGINITTSNCSYNLMYNNNFTSNGLNAYDNGTDNYWYNETLGNYWHNYIGKDVNDDGIGDTSHNLPGPTGSKDNYPIWWDAPNITIISPSNYSLFGVASPSFILKIVEGINDTMWYTLDQQATIYEFMLNNTINSIAWGDLLNGTHTITFFINDSKGYIDNEEVRVYKDIDAPIVNIISPFNYTLFGNNTINFSFSITEGNLNETWYTLNGGDKEFFSGTTVNIPQGDWDSLGNGSVVIIVYANDTLSNLGMAQIIIYKDMEPPAIDITSPDEGDLFGNSTISFDITLIEGNLNETWYTLNGGDKEFFSGTTVN
ncbi:MAG: nitrous oxide reductase family maturation protein NosD, partial [Candidatus Hodarchaeota archaeon]